MGQCNALVAIGMVVFIRNFSWVEEYLACSMTNQIIPPFINVSEWKSVREFSKGENKYSDMENIVKVL